MGPPSQVTILHSRQQQEEGPQSSVSGSDGDGANEDRQHNHSSSCTAAIRENNDLTAAASSQTTEAAAAAAAATTRTTPLQQQQQERFVCVDDDYHDDYYCDVNFREDDEHVDVDVDDTTTTMRTAMMRLLPRHLGSAGASGGTNKKEEPTKQSIARSGSSDSSDTESMTDDSSSSQSSGNMDQTHHHPVQTVAAAVSDDRAGKGGRCVDRIFASLASSCCPKLASSLPSTAVSSKADVLCNNLNRATTRKQALKLCFGSAGIYACYLWYGHLQEDVFNYRAADGSKFTQVWFLQVLECACNVVVGILGRRVFGGRKPVSYAPFFQSGASQVFSKVLTSLSLAAGLSFPVCILAKSAKMVPVMLGQLFLGGSKYTWKDYAFAGAVVVGTSMLSMGKSAKPGQPTSSSFVGLAFIVLSLVMDGVTGGLQKRLKKETEGQPPTTYDFLLFTNLSMGFVAFTIAFCVGDFASGMMFMAQNPLLQQMLIMECLLSAAGQSFIFYVVANFDPMVCATVTTTRKILSVLWSIAVKGHAVSAGGYAGLVIAIGGVLFGLQEKLTRKMKKRKLSQQLKEKKVHRDPPPRVEIGLC